MNPHLKHIILAALLTLITLGASGRTSSPAKGAVTAADHDRQKADYLYLEAKRHALQENFDSYFELMDYARRLNPADPSFGMDLGIYYLQLDSAGSMRGLDMMQKYVEENPDDLYSGYTFASIAQRLGRDEAATKAWRSLHANFPDREPVTLKYADILRRSGDSIKMMEAVAIYDTLSTRGADPGEITGLKSSVFFQLGDTAAVVREAHKLLESSPNNPAYNLYVGNIYGQLLDSDSALVFFNRAVELDPSNGLAYYSRAAFYNEKDDSVAYDREVFNALKQPDLELDVKLALLRDYVAKLYTDTLQQPRIAELFQTLNDQNPHQVDILNLYCEYLIAVGDYKGAAEQASYSLDLEPADQQRWRMLASLYLQLKDYDRTSATAGRGLHYFPGDADLYQLKGIGENLAKKYDAAEATFREAIEEVTKADSTQLATLSELYTGLADLYSQRGSKDTAYETYKKALELDPANLLALNNAAYLMACEGIDLDKALEMILKVVEAKPTEATSLDTYAWVLFKRKEYVEARAAIDNALNNSTDPSAEELEHAGDIYFMDGEPEQALDYWKQALELDPDNELLKRKVTHKTYFYK